MKKLFTIAVLALTVSATAQTAQDKINKTNYDLYRANNTIQNTNSTVNGTISATDKSVSTIKDGAKKVIGWLNSNKKKEENNSGETKSTPVQSTSPQQQVIADAGNGKTTVTINNCDFNTLREFANTLNSNSNVKSLDKSFNNNTATIEVNHTGNTDAILDFIDSKFPNKFNIIALQTGIINLALK